MAARTYVNDAGTWRQLKRVYVNDAGTWRSIRYVYVNDAGTWRTVFKRGDDYTITAGQLGSLTGFSSGVIGSISEPSGGVLDNGYTVIAIQDNTGSNVFSLAISGFSSDPGRTFLSDITANGTSFLEGDATTYNYSSGVATWIWTGLAGFVNGVSYSGVVAFT